MSGDRYKAGYLQALKDVGEKQICDCSFAFEFKEGNHVEDCKFNVLIEKVKAICDRCGKEGEIKRCTFSLGFELPNGWVEELNNDLCPECWAEWKKVQGRLVREFKDKFMNK